MLSNITLIFNIMDEIQSSNSQLVWILLAYLFIMILQQSTFKIIETLGKITEKKQESQDTISAREKIAELLKVKEQYTSMDTFVKAKKIEKEIQRLRQQLPKEPQPDDYIAFDLANNTDFKLNLLITGLYTVISLGIVMLYRKERYYVKSDPLLGYFFNAAGDGHLGVPFYLIIFGSNILFSRLVRLFISPNDE